MNKILRRLLSSLLFILVSVWLILSIMLYVFQSGYIYFPARELIATPANIQLPYEDILLKTDDGFVIHGWFVPYQDARNTIVFFHGNAGNISHRLDTIQMFHKTGANIFIIDYRGYGKSEGTPTEEGTYKDALAAWHYLTVERHIPSGQIIISGRSLGGAIAAWLATQTHPAALILESTFVSVVNMGKKYYPYLPVELLARIRYPTIDRIALVTSPVMIVHSINDEIIPYEQGRELFKKANSPKEFLGIRGGHNDGFLVSRNKYINGLESFIQKYTNQ